MINKFNKIKNENQNSQKKKNKNYQTSKVKLNNIKNLY